jgi:hypothetical protein
MFRLKFRFDFTRLCLLLASAVWLFIGAPQPIAAQTGPPGCPGHTPGPNPWNPCNWDAHKIMAEIENPHADLVTVAAHRGTHSLAGTTQAPGVAENSLEAIGIAAQQGWESIEIDVKRTSDGIPVLSHDKVWGRETCLHPKGNLEFFSPFDSIPPPRAGSIIFL